MQIKTTMRYHLTPVRISPVQFSCSVVSESLCDPWTEAYQASLSITNSWSCHCFPSKEQASFNFMAAVTICSDFGAQENKNNGKLFPLFPHLFARSDGTGCHGPMFLNVEFEASFSLSSFTFIKRLFNSSSTFYHDGNVTSKLKKKKSQVPNQRLSHTKLSIF